MINQYYGKSKLKKKNQKRVNQSIAIYSTGVASRPKS